MDAAMMAIARVTRTLCESVAAGQHLGLMMMVSSASRRLLHINAPATSTVFKPVAPPLIMNSWAAAMDNCNRQQLVHANTLPASSFLTALICKSPAAALHVEDIFSAELASIMIICPTGRAVTTPLGEQQQQRRQSDDCERDRIRTPETIGDRRRPAAERIEKSAARLIKIRRRKMRKHKLRKLRKKMFHVFAKIRQRREARKEKEFQDELLAQMNRADEFDARAWLDAFLLKATTDPQTLVPKKPKRVRPTRYVL